MSDPWLPLGVVLSSLLPGLVIFFLAETRIRLQQWVTIFRAEAARNGKTICAWKDPTTS